MTKDLMIHKVYDTSAVQRIPMAPECAKDVRYYYAENRLYLFQLPNGTVSLADGNSPRDAYERVASQFNGAKAIKESAEMVRKFRDEHAHKVRSIAQEILRDIGSGYRISGSLGSLINAAIDYEATMKEAATIEMIGGAK